MKNLILTLGLAVITTLAYAQTKTFQLSSHILDISKGMPASGVPIRLEKIDTNKKTWSIIDEKITDVMKKVYFLIATREIFYYLNSQMDIFS